MSVQAYKYSVVIAVKILVILYLLAWLFPIMPVPVSFLIAFGLVAAYTLGKEYYDNHR